MFSFRHTAHSHLTKAVAVLVSLLLFQALGAAIVHVTLVQHVWCENHHVFEHADTTDAGVHDDGRAHVVDMQKHPPTRKDGSSGKTCHFLTWLHGPTVTMPRVHISLLNLPPPAEPDAARPLSACDDDLSPIAILRLSPGHSPPVTLA